MAFGSSIYWPSYIFSIEPEVDGESLESFEKSVNDIMLYRKNKLFADDRYYPTMIFNAIGYCVIDSGLGKNGDVYDLYKTIFRKDNSANKQLETIRSKIIDMFDGSDYADIIKIGEDCRHRIM
ncbi:hypothetical protein [Aliarcobacter butzleri]|uniref:hypothetical protein n=1 Tax=Aliarcobacter butzleri TaxID=28197 RepID=UPI002B24A07B|nr:hypothetical protein [Aliarcobacter butzleri]